MTLHRGEDMPWDALSVGATRPAVIKALGIPEKTALLIKEELGELND